MVIRVLPCDLWANRLCHVTDKWWATVVKHLSVPSYPVFNGRTIAVSTTNKALAQGTQSRCNTTMIVVDAWSKARPRTLLSPKGPVCVLDVMESKTPSCTESLRFLTFTQCGPLVLLCLVRANFKLRTVDPTPSGFFACESVSPQLVAAAPNFSYSWTGHEISCSVAPRDPSGEFGRTLV